MENQRSPGKTKLSYAKSGKWCRKKVLWAVLPSKKPARITQNVEPNQRHGVVFWHLVTGTLAQGLFTNTTVYTS
jgi:hypothetical protein